MKNKFLITTFLLVLVSNVFAQVTERPRPKQWDSLVKGAAFIDRFLPMPNGKLSSDVWGGKNVLPRFIDNGIEDQERSFWGGNILRGEDGLYHFMFAAGRKTHLEAMLFGRNPLFIMQQVIIPSGLL